MWRYETGTFKITLSEPGVMKHGNKIWRKIHAEAPIHSFDSSQSYNEVAPIVGTQPDKKIFITYIKNRRAKNQRNMECQYFWKKH